ncbi:MAG: penicillin-binding transpeptidase domain-containing protein [Gemmatimonadota bacterium]
MRGASGRVPYTLASGLVDTPLAVPTTSGVWRPANYDGRFRGTVTLRQALELSLNVPFARLGVALGPERIRVTARRLGIVSELRPFPSLALGASEVTLLELTGAYAVLAASGLRAQPSAIIQELGSDGRTLERFGPPTERVYSPAETYLVTSALRGAVERGTGRGVRALGYRGPVAAKSGTTNGFRDAWFVGYTPELAVGVWVGLDDGESIGLSGSRAALPMFTSFLRGALGAEGRARFRYPEGLERAEVAVYQGLGNDPECLGTTELFLNGTVPARRCHEYGRLANAWRDGGRPGLRLLEWLERRLEQRVRRLLEVPRPGREMAPRGGRHPSDRVVPATRVPGQRRRQP